MRFPNADKFHRAKLRARLRGVEPNDKSSKWWYAVIEEYEKMGGTVADKKYIKELEELEKPKKTQKKVEPLKKKQ